jgi:hypothetical protein
LNKLLPLTTTHTSEILMYVLSSHSLFYLPLIRNCSLTPNWVQYLTLNRGTCSKLALIMGATLSTAFTNHILTTIYPSSRSDRISNPSAQPTQTTTSSTFFKYWLISSCLLLMLKIAYTLLLLIGYYNLNTLHRISRWNRKIIHTPAVTIIHNLMNLRLLLIPLPAPTLDFNEPQWETPSTHHNTHNAST